MIFCSAKKIFCGTKKIFFKRDSIFSGSGKIFSGTNSSFFLIDAIISSRKIISAMTTHFSGMEKIFLVPDTSFFAAKMMFSVAEKTVGAVPAGLFLNHQPFNIRWKHAGLFTNSRSISVGNLIPGHPGK